MNARVAAQLLALPARPQEVAGWLLGYWTGNGDHLFVTHATPPGPAGTAAGVQVGGEGHRSRFDEAWAASGGHVTFLGDWHTHPRGAPVPSHRDRQALEQLASRPAYGTPQPLITIVQVPSQPWWPGRRCIACYLRKFDGSICSVAPRITAEMPDEASGVPVWPWPAKRPHGA